MGDGNADQLDTGRVQHAESGRAATLATNHHWAQVKRRPRLAAKNRATRATSRDAAAVPVIGALG
jgi:hypothetical protein